MHARKVFVIMRQSRRSFVERVDFVTSPGNLGGSKAAARTRREQGWAGDGPSVVVTDLGVFHFDAAGEMRLDSIHPATTLEDVRAAMAWEPGLAEDIVTTPSPSAEDLRLIREVLDPDRRYTR
jgi:glutaconate CoA-transferase subunit B